jgi:equilibrative nucleoside transporter 1/2/3
MMTYTDTASLEVQAEPLDLDINMDSAFDEDAIPADEIGENEEIGNFIEADDDMDEHGLGTEPPDKCRGAWIMFLVMGIGLLFPWNAILQATDFFLYQFPCSPIEFDLSVGYMSSVLITMIIALVIMQYAKQYTAVARVTTGFVLMMASLIVYAAVGVNITYNPAVWTTVLSGVGDGLAQTGLYGLSSTLPPRYTTATMIGNGISGVVVTILRIATKEAFPSDLEGLLSSTQMYFSIATVFTVFCIICVVTIECVPVVKYYRKRNHYELKQKLDKNEKAKATAIAQSSKDAELPPLENDDDGTNSKLNKYGAPVRSKKKVTVVQKRQGFRFLAVLARMKTWAGLVFSTFLLTLAIYPGEVLEIAPTNATELLQGDGWFPVLIIGTFNVGDLIGRFIPFSEKAILKNPRDLWILQGIRYAVTLPIVLMLVFEVFRSDICAFAVVLFMAVTNGYISTVAMMLGPQQVEMEDRELGGSIMVFCLLTGLTLGAVIGLGLGSINPAECAEEEEFLNETQLELETLGRRLLETASIAGRRMLV